jgi:nucleotide-binding universal stress UspA family protein
MIESVVERSGGADLIVLNRSLNGYPFPNMRGIAGAVLTRSGKPVLAVPDRLERFNPFGRALFAWDNSKPAEVTMRASIPLLRLASEVRLFTVAERDVENDLTEAALYLLRHGVHAEIKRAYDAHHSVADVLMSEAGRWNADLLLMGAYGHSRLREALFGGTTEKVLTSSPVPTFLAH